MYADQPAGFPETKKARIYAGLFCLVGCESLDISAYALKSLLNHKMSNDVTAGHIIKDAERLRAPMQKITDYLLNSFANDIQYLSTDDKVNHAS